MGTLDIVKCTIFQLELTKLMYCKYKGFRMHAQELELPIMRPVDTAEGMDILTILRSSMYSSRPLKLLEVCSE